LSLAKQRASPATERQIAIELQKLRAVFGYEEAAWKVAAPLYLEALGDMPADLLTEAVATYIRMGEDRFPKPRQLRELVGDRIEARKDAVRTEEYRERSHAGQGEWPSWLEELWGPWPHGPMARRQAIEARERGYVEAAAARRAMEKQEPPAFVGGFQSAGRAMTELERQQIALGLRSRPAEVAE
jgi:hypothetical protein